MEVSYSARIVIVYQRTKIEILDGSIVFEWEDSEKSVQVPNAVIAGLFPDSLGEFTPAMYKIFTTNYDITVKSR